MCVEIWEGRRWVDRDCIRTSRITLEKVNVKINQNILRLQHMRQCGIQS